MAGELPEEEHEDAVQEAAMRLLDLCDWIIDLDLSSSPVKLSSRAKLNNQSKSGTRRTEETCL